jgi:hypothetical protein
MGFYGLWIAIACENVRGKGCGSASASALLIELANVPAIAEI